jgi:hypothetical protein
MKRTSRLQAIAMTVAVVFLTIISTSHAALAQVVEATPPPNGTLITNTYAAKFICGVQRDTTVFANPYPDAQAGRYSTKVNVHNNTGTTINFRKKIIRLLGSQIPDIPFEHPMDPQFKVFESLKEDQGLEVVCRDIYSYLNVPPPNPPTPWPYVEGFVIFEVYYQPGPLHTQKPPPPDPLDVEGIYTYKGDLPGTPTTPPSGSGVSIEVVVYPAKSNVHILH